MQSSVFVQSSRARPPVMVLADGILHTQNTHTLTWDNACIHKHTIYHAHTYYNDCNVHFKRERAEDRNTLAKFPVQFKLKASLLDSSVTSDPSFLPALCFRESVIIDQPIKQPGLFSSDPDLGYRWYELDGTFSEDCHVCACVYALCFAKRKYDGVHERRTAQSGPSVSTFCERHMCKSSVINHIPSIPSPLESAVKTFQWLRWRNAR